MSPVLRSVIRALQSTTSAISTVSGISAPAFAQVKADILEASGAVELFDQELQNLPQKLQNSTASVRAMHNPLVNISAAIYTIRSALQGLTQITGFSDEFVMTNARLNLMNDGLQTTAGLQDKILQSAQRSRSEYMATAGAVSKIGILVGESFGSNEEIIAFTELMNKTFKVGGSGVQEQRSAMYQLTQAMASGKLQGDEFRSIRENAPLLAKAIASFTGKSLGELKEMSAAGEITSEVIKGAMFSVADEINEKFKSIPYNFATIFDRMKNSAIESFQPVIERVNVLMNQKGFVDFTNGISRGIDTVAQKLSNMVEAGVAFSKWAEENKNKVSAGLYTIGAILSTVVTAQIVNAALAAQEAAVRIAKAGKLFGLSFGTVGIIAAIAAVAALVFWIKNLYETNVEFRARVQHIWRNYGSAIITTLVAISIAVTTIYMPAMIAAANATISYALLMSASAKILIADWLAVGAAFLLANSWIIAIAIAAATAVYAWNNLGDSGKMLAVVIGGIIAAVGLWTAAQWMLNFALTANPIGIIIMAIVSLIAMIAGVIAWVYRLWQTNIDFKYAVIGIWNGLLGFFERVPLFFQMVGNGVADVFGILKVSVLSDMEHMANGVINIVNWLISQINKIPGISIEPIAKLGNTAVVRAQEEAAKQERDSEYNDAAAKVAQSSANRDAITAANRIADEVEMANKASAEKRAAEIGVLRDTGGLYGKDMFGTEPDWTNFTDSVQIGGGYLDGINSALTLDEDSIELLRDVAAVEFVNKFTTLRPEMTVTFGEVRETADVRKILEVMEQMIEEAYASSLVGEGE